MGLGNFLGKFGYDIVWHHWEIPVKKHKVWNFIFLCKNLKAGYHKRVFFISIYKLRSYLNCPIKIQTVKQYKNASINVIKTRLITTKTVQIQDAKITNVQAVWKPWKQFLFWIRPRCTLHFSQAILLYSWQNLRFFLSLVGIGQCPKQS